MNKTLILGDIHGRPLWKDIITQEQPSRIIMLGDYVSSHDNISAARQIENLEEILALKEQRPEDVVLLRGNHDLQHLGYYWAECSDFSREVMRHLSTDENRERFLKLTQWVHTLSYGEKKLLCSHAGVSKVWLEQTGIGEVANINLCEADERFAFRPGTYKDHNGDSTTQPCTWIRPGSLADCAVDGYVHIVGHTPQDAVCHERIDDHTELWLVDALAHDSYLVLEDNEFIVRNLSL